MNTPIFDFLKNYVNTDYSRFHMPGHKGKIYESCLKEIFKYDITEIDGADNLYDSQGIIEKSEENTAKLYNAKHTSFSTGGSTLCIQAMLALSVNPGDTIIAARNVHVAFINACALLDINPHFVTPEYNNDLISITTTPEDIKKAIISCKNAKAVYITSPDYLGGMCDIKGIAKVCDSFNVSLIVDNAHGAHLKFTKYDKHPITLGATICCDSAHKTLPVLTGGAYLHISKKSNISKQQVKNAMSLFGSTSPSYLTLMSLDINNIYLQNHAKSDFCNLVETFNHISNIANQKGFSSHSKDITKLTLSPNQIGLNGYELNNLLNQEKIIAEYYSFEYVVLMLSAYNSKNDYQRIINIINNIKPKDSISSIPPILIPPIKKLSIRDALFSSKETVGIESLNGRVAAEAKILCPPGVPIVLPGEIINKQTQNLLKKSSILNINVVK